MPTPIYLNLSEFFSPTELLAFTMPRFSVTPSEHFPVTDSVLVELSQFATEKIVIQELASSFPYQSPLAEYFIAAESPVGVLPQLGSATYEKWEHHKLKEIQVTRRMHPAVSDPEETGRERLTGLRNRWSLIQNLGATDAATFWTFILNHVGGGIPFYFYDLENNGFFYDPNGVSTNGRYTVRFVPDAFSKEQVTGSRAYARFRFTYDLIEVEG